MEMERRKGSFTKELVRAASVLGIAYGAFGPVKPLEVSPISAETRPGNPVLVEQEQRQFTLTGIEVADLNPGGVPKYIGWEGEESSLLDNPDLSSVRNFIVEAIGLTSDYINKSDNEGLKGIKEVNAVVAGKRKEVNGEVTIIPTPPSESQKTIPVLITAPAYGFLVKDGKVYEYDNRQILDAMGQKTFPDNFYVFLNQDGTLTVADWKVGTVYAVGLIEDGKIKFEASKSEPERLDFSRMSQQQLAEIEKSAVFRFKDFKTFKELSLNYMNFTRGFSGIKGTVEAYIYPILLSKPYLENIKIRDISTNQTKELEVYVAPVLLKDSSAKYVVTSVILGSKGMFITKDVSSDGVVGGSFKQNLRLVKVEDFVASELRVGEQYGMVLMVSERPGGEKVVLDNLLKTTLKNASEQQKEMIITDISIMVAYSNNNRSMGTYSNYPKSIDRIPNSVGPCIAVVVGPQWG
jgi:hypothetical protein